MQIRLKLPEEQHLLERANGDTASVHRVRFVARHDARAYACRRDFEHDSCRRRASRGISAVSQQKRWKAGRDVTKFVFANGIPRGKEEAAKMPTPCRGPQRTKPLEHKFNVSFVGGVVQRGLSRTHLKGRKWNNLDVARCPAARG